MTRMNVTIRSELPRDYAQISEVNAIAFDYSKHHGESALVGLLRQRPGFDPELSIVAELNGQVIGHALFNPCHMRLGGKPITGVLLAPVAILPANQRQGVGKLLIREGLDRAARKGFALSLLLGHSDYYPQFGYRTNAFGTCQIRLSRAAIAAVEAAPELQERAVQVGDLPKLATMWEQWHGQVDLAIQPAPTLSDWLSVSSAVRSTVFVRNGEVVGYVRTNAANPEHVLYFLAENALAAKSIIQQLNRGIANDQLETLNLPVHPASLAAKTLIPWPYEPDVKTWEAAMIKPLQNNTELEAYCNETAQGARMPGLIHWPVEFDAV